MLPWTTFRNTVARVICALDQVDHCSRATLVKHAATMAGDELEGCRVLDKMHNAGLIALDGGIVGITWKGGALAADIRTLTAKAVR
jgi:hypothetical protein